MVSGTVTVICKDREERVAVSDQGGKLRSPYCQHGSYL